MAENNEKEVLEGAPKKSKKMLIIIAAAALVIILGGAGAAYMFLSGDGQEEVVEKVELPAVYTKIRTKNGKPMFVSTLLSNDDKVHYMQAYIETKSREPKVVEALEKHMPLIVSKLNIMFSSQEYKALITLAGKEDLRMNATTLIQDILQQRIGMPGVEEVLFTNFVMQ